MKEINYITASEAEELKNIAEQRGKDFDSVVLMYFQERLLYRLSISGYREKFLLKGGLFQFALTGYKARLAKGIDFSAKQHANDIHYVKTAFEAICGLSVTEDDVRFDVNDIHAECIDYVGNEGVRVKIPASLGSTKKIVQLEISFGDMIVPKPQDIEYPVLLNMTTPNIQAYSTEAVIAEKFAAIISSSATTFKMEDFYDIYTLLAVQNFDGRVLLEAVFETFQRKGTPIDREQPVLSLSFAEDEVKGKQWQAFISQNGFGKDITFHLVMESIRDFLSPIYQSVIEEEEYFKMWNSQLQKWE